MANKRNPLDVNGRKSIIYLIIAFGLFTTGGLIHNTYLAWWGIGAILGFATMWVVNECIDVYEERKSKVNE